jgi:hypothetical protein
MDIKYKLNVGKVVASGTNERFNHFYISILVNANLHSNLLDDKNLLSDVQN